MPGHGGQVLLAGLPGLIRADQNGQVLGHVTTLDGGDYHLFEFVGKRDHLGGVVEFAAMLSPRGQAKIDAIGLVEVGLPC